MANIESKLTTIRSASGGEDVRDAIIGALRDINNDVPADMSNPVQKEYNMPQGSDLTVPLNPPELVSQIIVRQPGSGGKSTTLNDITVTENGEYPADDPSYDPDKELRYYSKVTVKVPQLANAVLDLEEEITQNGTYSAPADWGVDGIRTFTVNVSGAGGDGPFQVEFYDKVQSDPTAKAIQTQIIPKNGSAIFNPGQDGYPKSQIGQAFVGWNPEPVNVTRDMKCYPRFSDQTIEPGEIGDDWTVILAKKGIGYPLGAKKSLAYGAQFTNEEMMACGYDSESREEYRRAVFVTEMVKVAEGEGGTNSTWLSRAIRVNFGNRPSEETQSYALYTNPCATMQVPYPNHPDRKFLNGPFYSHMSQLFKDAIRPVVKYTQTSYNTDPPFMTTPSEEYIWLPSVRELFWGVPDNPDGLEPENINGCLGTNAYDKYITYVPQSLNYLHALSIDPEHYVSRLTNLGLPSNGQFGMALRDCDVNGGQGGGGMVVMNPANQGVESGKAYNRILDSGDTRYFHAKQWGDQTYFIFGFCL